MNEFATRYDIALEESAEGVAESERPGGGMAWSAHGGAQGGVSDDLTDQLDDDELCKICYAQEGDVKLHPCGHQEICFACSIRCVVWWLRHTRNTTRDTQCGLPLCLTNPALCAGCRLTVCPVCRSPIDDREHVKKQKEAMAPKQPQPVPSHQVHQHQHHNTQPMLVQL